MYQAPFLYEALESWVPSWAETGKEKKMDMLRPVLVTGRLSALSMSELLSGGDLHSTST